MNRKHTLIATLLLSAMLATATLSHAAHGDVTNAEFIQSKLARPVQAPVSEVGIEIASAANTPEQGSLVVVAGDTAKSGLSADADANSLIPAGKTVQVVNTAYPGIKMEIKVRDTTAVKDIKPVMAASGSRAPEMAVVQEGGKIYLRAIAR